MAKQKAEKVKLCFSRDWFDQLMGIIELEITHCEKQIKSNEDPAEVARNQAFKKDLQALINKIYRYGHYEEHRDGCEVRVDFFASEARDLIWSLLFYSTRFDHFEYAGYYEKFKDVHDRAKYNDFYLPYLLTSGVARVLYSHYRLGYEELVRNEDGSLYYVDHGHGRLIKKDGKWVDDDWGETVDCIFEECNLNLIGVRWTDEEPTKIINWLEEEGWIREDGEFLI